MDKFLFVLLGVVAVLALLLFVALPAFIYSKICGRRQDRNPLLTYFSPEAFGLNAEPFPVAYKGEELYGALYYTRPLAECGRLVIFAHGLGPGHCAYTTEIVYFCNCGYAVLAYDGYGCDRSPGKSIGHFGSGIQAVVAAYAAADSDERLKGMKKILVGHSLGGYSVLCASEEIAADGVVAISAPDKPNKIGGSRLIGLMLQPMLSLLSFIAGGGKAQKSAVKAAEKCGAPTLLVWGERDPIVEKRNSAAALAEGAQLVKLILPDKRHNPYNTVAAEDKLSELNAALSANEGGPNTKREFFENFDFSAATEEDGEVMERIRAFIDGI